MRRVASLPSCFAVAPRRVAVGAASSAVTAARSVYSIWGSSYNEPETINKPNIQTPNLHKVMDPTGTRFHRLVTIASVDRDSVPAGVTLSEPEEYLLSSIEDDLDRINAVDWTLDFDSFWHDRVYSLESLFDTLYGSNHSTGTTVSKMIFSDCSKNKAAKDHIQARLNLLQATLKWAQEAEYHYSVIVRARFDMQRTVFDALEREKILAGCTVLVEEFKAKVPAEFARKATTDLEYHLSNLRHWVWDAPNAKMHFPRQLP